MTATSPRPARLFRPLLIVFLLLAFGLRAYHLDFQSLWSDEGISLLRSSQPLGAMWRSMPVEHVPGYFTLLHFWIGLTGESDYALRFFSLWASVLALALTYRLAADLASARIGLMAVALLATNGFQVWYAQEARMYSWLLAGGLLSTWLCWRLLFQQQPGRRTGLVVAYALATAATVYFHYFGFLVPMAHAVVAGGWLAVERRWRGLLPWIMGGLLASLLFLPWLPRAWQVLHFTGWREPLDPMNVPWMMWTAYTVGDTMPAPLVSYLPWLYLGLAVVGIGVWMHQRRAAGWFLLAMVAVPVLAILALVLRNPDFHVRYTIFISSVAILLAGGGVEGFHLATGQRWWGRGLSWLVAATLVTANGMALYRLYYDTSLHKPDFRSAARYIETHERPGDVILVDGPNPDIIFAHYYRGTAPVYDLRFLEGADFQEVDRALTDITAGMERAWELLLFRQPGPIQMWLATRGWAAAPTYHNDIRVSLYGLPGTAMERRVLNLPFGPELELTDVEVSATSLKPGDMLRISTHWRVLAQAPNYKFSLRLADAAGQPLANWDYVPQNWFAPTHVWVVGSMATDQHALIVPAELAPGRYQVTLRLYDPASGAAVSTPAGQDVLLAEVEVSR